MKRDDFTAAVKKLLRERVGHRCSNPECRVPTSGPSDPGKALNVGDAAHITAAAEGGPRYDPTISPDQRSAFENGIWLCTKCARIVDSSISNHSVDLLRQWKSQAEENAANEVGRPLPRAEAASEAVAAIVARAPTISTSLIDNAHAAARAGLEKLDNRFSISSTHDRGITTIGVQANEPVPLKMTIACTPENSAASMMEALFATGDTAVIPLESVQITGSPLFDHIQNETNKYGTGRLEFAPPQKTGKIKGTLISADGKASVRLDDWQCQIRSGYQRITISAQCFDGSTLLSVSLDPAEPSAIGFEIGFNFGNWLGNTVDSLECLDELHRFLRLLAEGWKLDIEVKYRGDSLVHGSVAFDGVVDKLTLIEYIRQVRTLSRAIRRPIRIRRGIVTREDRVALSEYIAGIDLNGFVDPEPQNASDPTAFVYVTDAQNFQPALNAQEPLMISFVLKPTEINLFGSPFQLPQKRIILKNVIPRVDSECTELRDGDSVQMRFERAPGFSQSIAFSDLSGCENSRGGKTG